MRELPPPFDGDRRTRLAAELFCAPRVLYPTVRIGHWAVQASRAFAISALGVGSAAITWASLVYFDDEELPPFVLEKLPLPHEALWVGVLQAHVLAAAFALPACLLLVSKLLLRRAPGVHRWLGRATGLVVVFALAPSGFYLSLFARGGVGATAGFILSGALAVGAMVQGVRTARARDFVAHQRWMSHVLVQLGVAVVSRALLVACDAAGVDPDAAYLGSLWGPVLGGAALVELWALARRSSSFPWRPHEIVVGSGSPVVHRRRLAEVRGG